VKRPLRPSLRWRLALWSAALAGGALLGFALLSSWLIYQAKVDRLDARLESLGPLARSGTGDGLPRQPEAAIAQALGLPDPQAVAMLAINPQGKIVYRSEQWPGPVPTTWPPWRGVGRRGVAPMVVDSSVGIPMDRGSIGAGLIASIASIASIAEARAT
jgi:hypothetical protein